MKSSSAPALWQHQQQNERFPPALHSLLQRAVLHVCPAQEAGTHAGLDLCMRRRVCPLTHGSHGSMHSRHTHEERCCLQRVTTGRQRLDRRPHLPPPAV